MGPRFDGRVLAKGVAQLREHERHLFNSLLPAEAAENVFELSAEELRKAGLVSLPYNLAEALDVMEQSELVATALGDHIFEWFLRNKRAEFDGYRTQVTPFELARYLPAW